jgi:hypothetical protein
MRPISLEKNFINHEAIQHGLTSNMLSAGIEYVYKTIDIIDEKLLEAGSPRISRLVELANLSTIIGNLFNLGIIKASGCAFEQAGPHKYQDLRATEQNINGKNIEIKVALEDNKPKGHLPKIGHYLTCRYVLGDVDGKYTIGMRGEIVWIWELRLGYLEEHHFNVSNTAGDSGKTAVVNQKGLDQLKIIYFDSLYCPYSAKSKYVKQIKEATTQFDLPLF